jgi:hypothetical protein
MGRKKNPDRALLIHDAGKMADPKNWPDTEPPDEVYAMDKAIMEETRVAHAQFKKKNPACRGEESVRELTTHQKMKVLQDYWTTAFLQQPMRVRFLQAALEDPIGVAKIVASMMPKELNVEVTKKEGVILVPMRMDNVEDWERMAMRELGGPVIEGEAVETSNADEWESLVYGANDEK